ncbi:MAG: hypothetical protein ACRC7G_01680 [Beijerinckiaceae bacterium]
MLQFWDASWDLNLDLCPCDLHFMEWVRTERLKGKVIYHFGTGSHHLVGVENLKGGEPNHYIGVTASPGEAEAFTKMAIDEPRLSANYTVHFGDIYLFNGKLLPKFDVATMFHLCEFWTDKNASYGAVPDEAVLRRVIAHMNEGGIIAFYEGSDGWRKTAPIVEKLAAEGLFTKVGHYKKLPLYQIA